MTSTSSGGVAIALLLGVTVLHFIFARTRRGRPPPGPRGIPLLGNIFDVPLEYQWLTFASWIPQYGDIMSVSMLGRRLVILSSYKHASELLDKRSAIYSDRPTMTFGGSIVGWDQLLVFLRYGGQFREYRRLMSRVLGSRKSVAQYASVIETQSTKLLARLLRDATNIPGEIRKSTGSIVLEMSYGYQAREDQDPFLRMVEDATAQAAEVIRPGAYLVDIIPLLRYVPSWFPGAGWKRKGERYRKNMNEMSGIPHQFVKDQMSAGTALPSFTAAQLALGLSPPEEYNVKMAAASIYAGGSDTTVSAEESVFLAMACFPEVQRKLQAELDAVVGHDRLPAAADLPNLPYLQAVYLELLRWNPVVPLGVPHAVSEDDWYEGHFISKGTLIFVNIWKLLHDPEVYPDPMTFNPDRFLGVSNPEPEADPRKIAFGFGRRICPGINLAEPSVQIMTAMVLSVFDISNPVHADTGEPIDRANVMFTGGTISHAPPFRCTVAPRSEKARALILRANAQAR